MKSENNQTATIHAHRSNEQFWNFYVDLVERNGGFLRFYQLDSETRSNIINQELEQFHASLHGHIIVFESEKYKTWFIMRWS